MNPQKWGSTSTLLSDRIFGVESKRSVKESSVLGIKILENFLEKNCAWMHGHTRRGLLASVSGLLKGERLTLTAIGRDMPGDADEKHKVKRVDRLLGNRHLQREVRRICAAIVSSLAGQRAWLPIVVDWTAGPGRELMLLEAAVPIGGRAVSIYHQVHRLSAYKNPRVQNQYLRRLAEIVGAEAQVVIVADAGFQRSFFETVEALGWHWIVRLGEPLSVRREATAAWQPLAELYPLARTCPRSLGVYELGKRACYQARVCVVAPPRQRRRDRPNNREHGHGTMARRYRKLYRGPWVLASNLPEDVFGVNDIVALYAERMQIEETFRDVKSHRFGYALDYTRTRTCRRFSVLRLLGTLALFVQCLVGVTAERKGWAAHFQVNTERRRRVLSWAFLARRVSRSSRYSLDTRELMATLASLPNLAHYQPLSS